MQFGLNDKGLYPNPPLLFHSKVIKHSNFLTDLKNQPLVDSENCKAILVALVIDQHSLAKLNLDLVAYQNQFWKYYQLKPLRSFFKEVERIWTW